MNPSSRPDAEPDLVSAIVAEFISELPNDQKGLIEQPFHDRPGPVQLNKMALDRVAPLNLTLDSKLNALVHELWFAWYSYIYSSTDAAKSFCLEELTVTFARIGDDTLAARIRQEMLKDTPPGFREPLESMLFPRPKKPGGPRSLRLWLLTVLAVLMITFVALVIAFKAGQSSTVLNPPSSAAPVSPNEVIPTENPPAPIRSTSEHIMLDITCKDLDWFGVEFVPVVKSRRLNDAMKIISSNYPATNVKIQEVDPAMERRLLTALAALRAKHGAEDQALLPEIESLANYYLRTRNFKDAQSLFGEAMKIRLAQPNQELREVHSIMEGLGRSYLGMEDYERAAKIFEDLFDGRVDELGAHHPDSVSSLERLAYAQLHLGHNETAESIYQIVLEHHDAEPAKAPSDIANVLDNLGQSQVAQGKFAEARPMFERALAIRMKENVEDNPSIAVSHNFLAVICAAEKKLSEAERHLAQSETIINQALGSNSAFLAVYYDNHAKLLYMQAKFKQAIEMASKALQIRKSVYGPEDSRTKSDPVISRPSNAKA